MKTKAALGLSGASTLGQVALQLSDYHNRTLASFLVVAMIAPAAYAAWHGVNVSRENRGKPSLRLDPTYIIILGLVTALGGVIWQWQRDTSSAASLPQAGQNPAGVPQPNRKSATFLKDLTISADSNGQIAFSGVPRITNERLRVLIYYSWRNLLGLTTWVPRIGVKIGDVSVIRDQRANVSLASISSPGAVSDLYWGNPKENYPLGQGPNRVCLVIIGPNDVETTILFRCCS